MKADRIALAFFYSFKRCASRAGHALCRNAQSAEANDKPDQARFPSRGCPCHQKQRTNFD
jgi:hypothetical protein